MYQAVIFDLDGTLLNTLDDLADAGNHVLGALGFAQHPVQAYCHMVGNGVPRLVERMLPEQARGAATQQLALHMFLEYYGVHSAEKTAPYKGIKTLLSLLRERGVRIGVVSNKENALTQQVTAHYFGETTFDAVRGHTLGSPTKPDPHLVNELRAQFGTAAEQTLYVGDSDVDMQTAQRAGLAGCGVVWGFRSREELQQAGAAYLVQTPAQLAKLILEGAGPSAAAQP